MENNSIYQPPSPPPPTLTTTTPTTFVSCSLCDFKVCGNFSQLLDHIKQVHWDAKPFACMFCPFRAKQKETLDGHVRFSHFEAKSFSKINDASGCGGGGNGNGSGKTFNGHHNECAQDGSEYVGGINLHSEELIEKPTNENFGKRANGRCHSDQDLMKGSEEWLNQKGGEDTKNSMIQTFFEDSPKIDSNNDSNFDGGTTTTKRKRLVGHVVPKKRSAPAQIMRVQPIRSQQHHVTEQSNADQLDQRESTKGSSSEFLASSKKFCVNEDGNLEKFQEWKSKEKKSKNDLKCPLPGCKFVGSSRWNFVLHELVHLSEQQVVSNESTGLDGDESGSDHQEDGGELKKCGAAQLIKVTSLKNLKIGSNQASPSKETRAASIWRPYSES